LVVGEELEATYRYSLTNVGMRVVVFPINDCVGMTVVVCDVGTVVGDSVSKTFTALVGSYVRGSSVGVYVGVLEK